MLIIRLCLCLTHVASFIFSSTLVSMTESHFLTKTVLYLSVGMCGYWFK